MAMIPLLPVISGTLGGQPTPLLDARLLHQYLEVGRDYTNWIKGRIEEYGFEEGSDFLTRTAVEEYSPNPAKNRGRGRPTADYFLTLDMAKELAMVERTPRGRQARRYFIECERQWRQLRHGASAVAQPPARPLSRAQRQAINRQAWSEAAGEVYAAFHARREALLAQASATPQPRLLPPGFRPPWAR